MPDGYFDCICCGTTDMNSDADAPPLCDSCVLCECGEDGDSPECKHLLVEDSRGIYIPQFFARYLEPLKWGVSQEDIDILLAGPDHDLYWETWGDIDGRVERDLDGKRWVLVQDGDLWAQCVGRAAGSWRCLTCSRTGIGAPPSRCPSCNSESDANHGPQP